MKTKKSEQFLISISNLYEFEIIKVGHQQTLEYIRNVLKRQSKRTASRHLDLKVFS